MSGANGLARAYIETSIRQPLEGAPSGRKLSEEHRRTLEEESGISAEIVAGRGYWTATSRAQLARTFAGYQRRAPALVIPMFSPDGVATSAQIRPRTPRKDKRGKPIKYETAYGAGLILDVHPSMLRAVRDPRQRLFVTEGCKKGDSLASRGECAISLSGVWNWQRGGEPLACWEHVALEGREVYVVFDSDVTVKKEVQLALERLVGFLEARGATVRVVYLPGGGS